MATPERKFPSDIEFFFEFAKDYKIIASNGAWGGVTPKGRHISGFFCGEAGSSRVR
jgi:hypothetical protein